MGKSFAVILLSTFLILHPAYCQHDVHQLPHQEFSAGVGLGGTEAWTQVGGKLHYGLSPEVTGHIFGSVRFLRKDPLLSASDIDFSPSPGVGVGLSSRDFADGSNVGFWGSAFISRRWAKVEQKSHQTTTIKGRGTSIGFAGGPVGRVITQSDAALLPFIGASYNISEVFWKGSDIVKEKKEWYTDLGGIMGMEVKIENMSLLGFINFSLEGEGTNVVISSFFRPKDGKLPWIKQEPDQDIAEALSEEDAPNELGHGKEIALAAVGTLVFILALMFSE